ncbi:c-type cytochrome [Flavihumibacter solisilvae]|uniref:c-type cytochrome n=1 Tax=Flavihumibacter solisilvae TaxID=1349421 RepID=UPI0009E1B9C2|nr:cytochrome c [Flavihumibacter solisilvae]
MTRIWITAILLLNIICGGCDQYATEEQNNPLFGLGVPATDTLIRKWDDDVRPDGKGFPAGEGDARSGKIVYSQKCASCHGANADDNTFGKLVSLPGDTSKSKSVGSYWPYASTVFDYIRRAMPFNAPGSLTNDEVYGLTAFILAGNSLIPDTVVLDASVIPKIQMPAMRKFVPDDRNGGFEVR